MPPKFSPPPSKEASVIILDIGKTMTMRGSKALEDSKKAISLLVKMKVNLTFKKRSVFLPKMKWE